MTAIEEKLVEYIDDAFPPTTMARDTGQAVLTSGARRRCRQLTVATAMFRRPDVHPSSATVGELRTFFANDHVHIALLVDEGRLVAAVERADLDGRPAGEPAARVAGLDGRTIGPDVSLPDALTAMTLGCRRRLAVATDGGELVGLLCLKSSGQGFCSDGDVEARRRST